MKKVFLFTLNEKVFCELYSEKGKFYVSAYFRFSKKTQTAEYKTYQEAFYLYNYVIK